MKFRSVLILSATALAAACAPKMVPPPKVEPPVHPVPKPLPAPPPAAQDWRDIALTPGAWSYRSEGMTSQASFGVANSEAQFIVRCDRARRQIILSREGVPASPAMTIRTSFTARALPATIQSEPMAYAIATLGATDPILDSMAFSRGRFTVEAQGLPMLVIPAWPEPARVIEDCRG